MVATKKVDVSVSDTHDRKNEASIGRPLDLHERVLLKRASIFRWGDPGTDAWCSDINPLADGVMDTREALMVAADSVTLA